ncbi:penicillin-binding protein 1A [Marinobacter psychrophilus]|uniref:penicillin-binding protein 1A n=1 Tax=Marinobacter psychrophilus TaxID=330734 RepID=UPI001B79A0D9|nr:penicillin-binding protein 1A [Marinobacter psychrophilus]MBQ0844183.1 penicillin-binding protein 1A [Marinobacter psychrophilus]
MSYLMRTSRLFIWFFLTGLSVTLVLGSGFYLYLRPGLPAAEQLFDIKLQTPLRIFSQDGKLIAEFGEKRRTPVTIEQVPERQLQAFLAAEDSRFYEHFGVDIKGLARAALELASTGHIQSGGSTITMQVAKNYFLSRDRTFIRKFNEILLALQIERELDKNTILELYLNKIYLGNRAYGIAAASQVYYNKPVSELTLAQMAMLAGLPKAPSAFNPLANPSRALARRNWILGRMKELEMISQDDYEQAVNAELTATYNATETEVDADYVAEMARAEMFRRFGDNAYTDGYSVTLTVDSVKQQTATEALRQGLEAYDRRHGFRGAVGTIDIKSLDANELATALRSYPRTGPLIPAVVLKTDDKNGTATLHARLLGPVTMTLDTMTWAQRYRTENLTGPTPKTPSDVLSPGDVVYVKALNNAAPQAADDGRAQPLTDVVQNVALYQVPRVEGALIALTAETGAIEALGGGYSFGQSKYNRAIQAKRQPGSTFKPFLYLNALESGFTPATLINDSPIVLEEKGQEIAWRPQNSSGQFYGPTRLREALYRSRNLVSVRLLRDIGIQPMLDYLEQLKVPTADMPANLSLALGSGLLSPMELARGMAVIANGGYDVEPFLIRRIEDARGTAVYQAPDVILCDSNCGNAVEIEEIGLQDTDNSGDVNDDFIVTELSDEPLERIVQAPARRMPRLADERSVYILHSMMRDVIKLGTGRRASALNRDDLAGKTGTTNEQIDTWFAGFNYKQAVIAWVGFDQPAPLGRNEFGASTALPIWIDYMKVALDQTPSAQMPRPNGIVNVRINADTGRRARPGEEGVFELFREEDEPEVISAEERGGLGTGDTDDISRQLF